MRTETKHCCAVVENTRCALTVLSERLRVESVSFPAEFAARDGGNRVTQARIYDARSKLPKIRDLISYTKECSTHTCCRLRSTPSSLKLQRRSAPCVHLTAP